MNTTDVNVLDNDVLNTIDDTETLALNDTLGALTNQGLVGINSDTKGAGVVTSAC